MTAQSDSALPAPSRDRWPYAPHYANVNGWRMHYVDEGEGDPVVLLHGNPTWGFLYRDVIAPLVGSGHRVIVPDMIGFGLSEKPTREQAHCLDGHPRSPTRAPERPSREGASVLPAIMWIRGVPAARE
jgi:haloalkane dehalogenase